MEWLLYVSLILILVLLIVLCVALWSQTGRQFHQTDRKRTRGRGKRLVAAVNSSRVQQVTLKKQSKQKRQQVQVDSKIALGVKHLYEHYGEEWINNAGRSRLAMAIDEMLGPASRRNSNAARAQRTLAAAILETVLERKGETVRQQQAASQEDSQAGIVVDPMLAADIVDTAQAFTADTDYTNDIDGADDVDDFDDIDDIDVDVDLDLD